MGMIVTLYLISANTYNSVDAPPGRGFSYIELWMLGSQFPILLALCEYGMILYLKKIAKKSHLQNQIMDTVDSGPKLDDRIKKFDFKTLIFSIFFFSIFTFLYWIILLL